MNVISEEISQIVEALYVVSEVIRFTERLLNMALTSSTHVTLVCCSLNFYLWVCYRTITI